jgi:hypothetical protein
VPARASSNLVVSEGVKEGSGLETETLSFHNILLSGNRTLVISWSTEINCMLYFLYRHNIILLNIDHTYSPVSECMAHLGCLAPK